MISLTQMQKYWDQNKTWVLTKRKVARAKQKYRTKTVYVIPALHKNIKKYFKHKNWTKKLLDQNESARQKQNC